MQFIVTDKKKLLIDKFIREMIDYEEKSIIVFNLNNDKQYSNYKILNKSSPSVQSTFFL